MSLSERIKAATAVREMKDYRDAFDGKEHPAYCPVRINKNRLNKHGNVCGIMRPKTPEPIRGHAGQLICWRCPDGHLFGKMPEAAA